MEDFPEKEKDSDELIEYIDIKQLSYILLINKKLP